jgi:hypothetical protein
MPLRAAFSLGDILIALGAFRLLWSLSGNKEPARNAYSEQLRATS